MKTFKELREYLDAFGGGYAPVDQYRAIADIGNMKSPYPRPMYAINANSMGPGMGTFRPMNIIAAQKRKPKTREGQNPDSHSDLYTDEDPKGTIQGLGFTDATKAKQSVNKIENSDRTHAHKIQAAIAMEQRARVAADRAKDPQKKKDLSAAAKVYRSFIDKMKQKTKEKK